MTDITKLTILISTALMLHLWSAQGSSLESDDVPSNDLSEISDWDLLRNEVTSDVIHRMIKESIINDNERDKRLPRYGRSMAVDDDVEDDRDKRLPRMGKRLPRLGKRLPRFGRSADEHEEKNEEKRLPRMGKRDEIEESFTDESRDKRLPRFGRAAPFPRLGRASPFPRLGRASPFPRLGRSYGLDERAAPFPRLGRSGENTVDGVELQQVETRASPFPRLG